MTQQTIEQAITDLKTAMEGEDATRWIDDLLPSHMKDIIVVLEIPHRSDPRTWIAFSEEELLSKVDDGQALLSVGTFCGNPRTPHLLCTQAFWERLSKI